MPRIPILGDGILENTNLLFRRILQVRVPASLKDLRGIGLHHSGPRSDFCEDRLPPHPGFVARFLVGFVGNQRLLVIGGRFFVSAFIPLRRQASQVLARRRRA